MEKKFILMISNLSISVIVPTYNRADIIVRCLDSLVTQDYHPDDFEIIVVDNNSSDNTREVVQKYIETYPGISIQYILESRQGLVYARHAGAKLAKYEILSFTDDDGILSPIWLKEVARVFSMNSEVAAVAGKILIRWDMPPPEWVILYEGLLGRLDYGEEIIIKKGLYINGGNFNIKKNVLNEVGGFNPDQIGDWLIGDGESGLCRKLHEKGYLIGWAPAALMEHYQVVSKNATLKDIKRRYVNNGRCVPYKIFAIDQKGFVALMVNLIYVSWRIAKECLRYLYNVFRKNKLGEYDVIFNIAFYSCQFPYTFRLLTDKDFREMLLKKDWL